MKTNKQTTNGDCSLVRWVLDNFLNCSTNPYPPNIPHNDSLLFQTDCEYNATCDSETYNNVTWPLTLNLTATGQCASGFRLNSTFLPIRRCLRNGGRRFWEDSITGGCIRKKPWLF